jgi:hypothetical protein
MIGCGSLPTILTRSSLYSATPRIHPHRICAAVASRISARPVRSAFGSFDVLANFAASA